MSDAPDPAPDPEPEPEPEPVVESTDETTDDLGRATEDGKDYLGRDLPET